MINIIPTLTVMDTYEEYEVMINNFIASDSNLFRCNATRFDNNTYINSIKILQEIYYKKKQKYFNLLLDIPCPKEKIRVEFKSDENDILIKEGEILNITNDKNEFDGDMIFVDIGFNQIEVGETIILGDGDLFIKVISKLQHKLICKCLNTGILGYRKALYTSRIYCKKTSNETVYNNIKLIETLRPTHIALSFVEDVQDITNFKNSIKEIRNYNPTIISKLETKCAIDNLEDLIKASPNVMIARGDLALSAGYEMLFKYQNEIIEKCSEINNCGVYFASEIINSLVNSPVPTRPEICDLANMINQGAKNIILSGPLCRYNNYNIAVKYINNLYDIYHIR